MSEKEGSSTPVAKACPIPATHDKFFEGHYFLDGMLENYHQPREFSWNLNAFLQALRSVTLMLQSELRGAEGFDDWYAPEQQRLSSDPVLKRFVKGRNFVVHQGMLRRVSTVQAGVFRGKRLKLAITADLDIDVPTEELLRRVVKTMTGYFIDEEHTAIGEQLGVKRTWQLLN